MARRVCLSTLTVLAAITLRVVQGFCTCSPQPCLDVRTTDQLFNLNASVTSVTCISTNTIRPALVGKLSPAIAQLSALTWLHLQGGDLGSIPTEVGKLEKLELLWLPQNKLKGSIPAELGDLGSLKSVNLNVNSLTGSLPDSLGSLSNLENFEVWRNDLSGSLPSSIGNWKKVQSLWLNKNKFSGNVPNSISGLTSLTNLVISDNEFTGQLPELGNLNLHSLYVKTPFTCGTVPSFVAQHTDLPPPDTQMEDCSTFLTSRPTVAPSAKPTVSPTESPIPGTRSPTVTKSLPPTGSPVTQGAIPTKFPTSNRVTPFPTSRPTLVPNGASRQVVSLYWVGLFALTSLLCC